MLSEFKRLVPNAIDGNDDDGLTDVQISRDRDPGVCSSLQNRASLPCVGARVFIFRARLTSRRQRVKTDSQNARENTKCKSCTGRILRIKYRTRNEAIFEGLFNQIPQITAFCGVNA